MNWNASFFVRDSGSRKPERSRWSKPEGIPEIVRNPVILKKVEDFPREVFPQPIFPTGLNDDGMNYPRFVCWISINSNTTEAP